MKYWEVIADRLHAEGWSWGYCSAVTRDDWRWILDAHREDGRRYIVQSDELLSAFLELERVIIGQYEPPQIGLKCVRSVRSRSRNDTKS